MAPIQTILTPQGAEYRAVCRGMRRVKGFKPEVMAIPMGPQAVAQYLEQLPPSRASWEHSGVLLMGLGGSLSTHLRLGDVVLCQACIDAVETSVPQRYECDRALIAWLRQRLKRKAALGVGLTCDRVISSLTEKRQLGDAYSATMVDMESAPVLKHLGRKAASVAILRVISDDCRHNLPDIASAITPDGSLPAFPLAVSFLRRPLAAAQLIRGSLQGLQILQQVTTELFSE